MISVLRYAAGFLFIFDMQDRTPLHPIGSSPGLHESFISFFSYTIVQSLRSAGTSLNFGEAVRGAPDNR